MKRDDAGHMAQGAVEIAKLGGALMLAASAATLPSPTCSPRPAVVAAASAPSYGPGHDMPERDSVVELQTTNVVVTGSGGEVRAHAGTAHATAQAFDATVVVT
ncbi:hypothetical protein AB0M46_24300 [Dactylosporangium sp. NPDC051485]|uniref:hypothetical protein n=1 Tax=Dactylosporangium sp. NPDC051485 TaxID=3154846 RepID=UPI00342990D1